MSNNIFALIILACLVAEASCLLDCFKSKCTTKEDVGDFQALNEYLEQNVGTNEIAANLNHLRVNMASLKDEPVRKAAVLVVEVAKMDKQCKLEVLPTLTQLAHANLSTDWQGVNYRENTLLEGVGLRDIVKDCYNKLGDLYHGIYDTMKAKGYDNFMRELKPMKPIVVYGGDAEDIDRRYMVDQVRYIVNADKMAQHEEDEPTSDTVKHDDKVKETVETYLLKPCRELRSDPRLEVLIKGGDAMIKLGGPDAFPGYLHRLVNDIVWQRNTCKKFLEMKASARAKYFKGLI